MRKILLAIAAFGVVIAAPFSLTACNTVAGAGKDVQRGGEAVTDTAKDVQKKM